MAAPHRLNISNLVTEIRRVHTWLEQACKEMAVPEDIFFKFDLTSEEIVTNLISYAFHDKVSHEILLRLIDETDSYTLVIEDDGTPFNPWEFPKHVEPENLDEAKIGGLGIHLMRHHIDKGKYEQRDGKNILTLTVMK